MSRNIHQNLAQHEDSECDAPEDYVPRDAPALAPEDRVQSDAIIEPPVQTQLTFPADGLFGYYGDARKFGIQGSIDALREAGRIWRARTILPSIGIGDISKSGGGEIKGHNSHRKGVDVDIRPLMRDGEIGPVIYRDAKYSPALTQELIDILYANGVLALKLIFFNDPNAKNVTWYSNHDNHLHVRFRFPGEQPALPTLAQGSHHPAVRDAQRRLNFWIAAAGPGGIAPITVDGDFGPATRDAVRAFQTAKALPVDGRITRGGVWEALPEAPIAGVAPSG